MPVLCFVLDTSASMNRRTAAGQRVIDIAKTAIDNFLKKVRAKEPSARTDQYLLLTTCREQTIRVGPKDSPTIFWRELYNIQADDQSDLGHSIQTAFDVLNMERFDTEMDSIGRGRQPWSIRPAAVIVLSDGGMLTSQRITKPELELPGSSLPGSPLITEPFRWDQRVYSLCLRLGGGDGDTVLSESQPDPLTALSEVTGGSSYQVTCPNTMMDTLQSINSKLQTSDRAGIIMNFEKLAEKNGVRPELTNGPDAQQWHRSQQVVYVRTNYKTGNFLGFWPIPEQYYPDVDLQDELPRRSAQPVLKFSTKDVKFKCLPNFAFDKLEMEKGPLVKAMLERNRPDAAWQVFVENSGPIPGIGKPIGYLKPNSSNEVVHLFLHPYDYEIALNLVDELFQLNMTPTTSWKTNWTAYLRDIPKYYMPHLRKSLHVIHAPPGLVPEALDLKLPNAIDNMLKKIKSQLRNEVEKLIDSLRIFRERAAMNNGKPIVLSDITFGLENDIGEFANFSLFDKVRSAPKQPLLEPFEVERNDILTQLERMRASFKQCLVGGVPLHHEAILHEMPQANMGNYQESEKKISRHALRDPFEDPSEKKRSHGFGNPYKSRNDTIDVDGIGMEMDGPKMRRGKEEPAKRRMRKRNLSFRNRGSSHDSGMHSDSENSDTSSVNGDVFEKQLPLENGICHQNGVGMPLPKMQKRRGVYSNGMVNGYGNHHDQEVPAPTPRRASISLAFHDEKVYSFCRRLICRMGREDEKFVEELLKLKDVDKNIRLITVRRLQRDALDFSRSSMFQILEQFLFATDSL